MPVADKSKVQKRKSSDDSFANDDDDIEAPEGKKKSSLKHKDKKERKKKKREKTAKEKIEAHKFLEVMENACGIEKSRQRLWSWFGSWLWLKLPLTLSQQLSHSGRLAKETTVAKYSSIWGGYLVLNDPSEDDEEVFIARWARRFMCCFRWNSQFLLYALNITVVLNPFFGCVIAWILLYQSNEFESFLVLGLEGASIFLHFISVWVGGCHTRKEFCFHCIQLVPFLTSVVLILLYLRQGGVCYLVSQEKFVFTGCEVCPNGILPDNGVCQLGSGTNITVNTQRVWQVQGNIHALGNALVAHAHQASYCDHPDGPDVNFCFFSY